MSTKIFTFTHKKFTPPLDKTYVPIQVGAAVSPSLGYLSDGTGDNISDLNKYYGELTGMYWIWKNYAEDDYIGTSHYRRYFINESQQLVSEAEVENILQTHDVIVPVHMNCGDRTYYDIFAAAHGPEILNITRAAIQTAFPEYDKTFQTVFSEHTYYYGNLFITSHSHFNEYMEWLFQIFTALEPTLKMDFTDLYHQRVFGFISENLIHVWARHQQLSLYECAVGITSEKAETKEFKLAMSQLFKTRQIQTAHDMFYEYLKLRPDIRLPLSDLHGEIPIIEQLIYICTEEDNAGLSDTLDYSSDLNHLIQLFRAVKAKILEQDTEFLSKYHISRYMIAVIIANSPLSPNEKQEYLLFYTLS